MSLIQRVTRERNIMSIVALRDLNLAARYADDLILMSGGRIVERGSAEAVLISEGIAQAYSGSAELPATQSALLAVAAGR